MCTITDSVCDSCKTMQTDRVVVAVAMGDDLKKWWSISNFFFRLSPVYRDLGKIMTRIWREGMTASMRLFGLLVMWLQMCCENT